MSVESKQERMLSAAEVSELLGVTPNTVYVLAREDKIPHVRINRSVRFNSREIAVFMRSGYLQKRGEQK